MPLLANGCDVLELRRRDLYSALPTADGSRSQFIDDSVLPMPTSFLRSLNPIVLREMICRPKRTFV